MTARRISPSSATEVVGASPVVPLTTRPSLPWSARWTATLATPSRSTLPSAVNGVTIAVSTRPNGAAGRLMLSRLSIVHLLCGGGAGTSSRHIFLSMSDSQNPPDPNQPQDQPYGEQPGQP